MHIIRVSCQLACLCCASILLQVENSLQYLLSFTDLVIVLRSTMLAEGATLGVELRRVTRSREKSLVLLTSNRVGHESKLLVLR